MRASRPRRSSCTIPEVFIKKRGIDLHLKAEVIEVEQGRVRVREEDGEKTYEWDYLVFANGASPQVPAIEGIDLPGVFTADLPPDAVAITEYLEKTPSKTSSLLEPVT